MAGKKKVDQPNSETDVKELCDLAAPHVEAALRQSSESGNLKAIDPAKIAAISGKIVDMLPAIIGGLQTLGVPIPANGAAIAAFAVNIFHQFSQNFPHAA